MQWIRQQEGNIRRLCSVCTGSFFLAETGILSGKKVATHWAMCELLSRTYPDIRVESEPIFIKDGGIYTSAGISSGMDLALSLIEEDYGRALALEVAKQMVLYLKRPGTQSQYSLVLTYQKSDYRPVQDILNWITEHLSEELTVERLAEQSSMSPRNFARVFVRETGITPAKYIDKIRLERACRYLAETQLSVKEIAKKCGLGTPDNMRRIFVKYLHTIPTDYRRNFGGTA
nr:helix-turn-helix domain-containing protein [Dysgonomonas sp. 521]